MTAKQRKMNRASALDGRPRKLPFLRRQEQPNGGARVTVSLRRSGIARWLGGDREFEKTFGLDAPGREVYDACDGRQPVRAIIRDFAAAHRISTAEAELAVTTFLKTLMGKGLVAVMLDEDRCKR